LHTWKKKNAYGILVGKLKKRGHLEGLGAEMSILLKGVIKQTGERTWTGSIRLTTGARGELL
jgi:hypothetical protein